MENTEPQMKHNETHMKNNEQRMKPNEKPMKHNEKHTTPLATTRLLQKPWESSGETRCCFKIHENP